MVVTLFFLRHSCEFKLEMDKMSEFVLLTYMEHLFVRVVFTLVKNACESAFDVTALVQVEKAVIKHGSNSLWEFFEGDVNCLVLLKLKICLMIQVDLIQEVRIIR